MFENYTVTTEPYNGALEIYKNIKLMTKNNVINHIILDTKLRKPEEQMVQCRGMIMTEKDPVRLMKMKSRILFGIYDFADL